MRVVLDTNVVISNILSPLGPSARVIQRWREQVFEVLISEAMLAEYRKILGYNRLRVLHHLSDERIDEFIDGFRQHGTSIDVTIRLDIIKEDPDDNRVLECAIEGSADYIVSGDKDILRLKEYEGIVILPPAAFLLLLEREQT